MLFSSIPFLYYFLPCVLIAYYLVPKPAKNMVLLLASLVFYGWGEPSYVFMMIGSILIGYAAGIWIEKLKETPWAKVCFIISLSICFGLLGVFKYADFFISNVNAVTGIGLPVLKAALPIGISFYTFQLASYVIDVYWGRVKAQKNPFHLATYITMFPQLIAGPIVRYSDVEKQLTDRTITFDKIAWGIRRFILGLGKKVLIANVLGEFCNAFQNVDEKSLVFYWFYAIAVSLQIYFDFSGYSDMAIGLGSMLGFRFAENFNYPFISQSATEFWRRWHMSLGTWFRDYVYIPLGGSRCSKGRNLINIFIVWMLTGLWHGAQWTFIVWGLYFGVLLIIEKLFLLKKLERCKVFGHLYILMASVISFVIFDALTLQEAMTHIGAMFGMGNLAWMTPFTGYYVKSYMITFVIAVVGATPLPRMIFGKIEKTTCGEKILSILEPVFMVLLLLVTTGYLVDGSFNPFLYFRF